MTDEDARVRGQMVVPRVTAERPFAFDFRKVDQAEARIAEIAVATPMKAPELMATFNDAYLVATKAYAAIQREHVEAVKLADQVRARVVLDKVPGVLADRGIKNGGHSMGTKDIRDAIVSLDTEFIEADERATTIKCYLELVKGHIRALEMAFGAVKKMLDERTFNYAGRTPGTQDPPRTASKSSYSTPKI